MKKIALLLALVMVIGMFAGCGGGADSTTEPIYWPATTPTNAPSTTPANTEPSVPAVEYAPEGITLLSCRFDQEVTAQDREYTAMLYADRANQVYVDMIFYVSPAFFKGGKTLPRFSANITYNDYTYELEYTIETAGNTSFEKASVPTTGGYVHMITSLPEEAMDLEGLEVRYSIGREQYTCQVAPIATESKLDNKTELTVDLQDAAFGGMVEIEVIDIRCEKYLVATKGGEDDRYDWYGAYTYVDVILKVTNNFASESISAPLGYIIEGSSMAKAAYKVETNNNTKLDNLTSIEPGQTEYIHVYATIEESSDEVGLRINWGGKLYYCTIANTAE